MPNTQSKAGDADAGLEAAAHEVIAACDGEAFAAVKVLLVTVDHLQRELAARDAEMARLADDVSRGYARGRWERLLERADKPIP